jgi:two-component system response regulator HydG
VKRLSPSSAAPRAPAACQPREGSRRPASILVIDAELCVRETISVLLEGAGHAVTAVADAPHALEAVAAGGFDVAFVDLQQEQMSGLDLFAELRRRAPGLVLVATTAMPNVETAVRALRQQAFDYLAKPIHRDQLLRTTHLALRHKRGRDANDRCHRALEAAFRSVSDGIVVVDEEMRLLAVNDSAERLCGGRACVLGGTAGRKTASCRGTCAAVLRETLVLGDRRTAGPFDCGSPRQPGQVVTATAWPLRRDGAAPASGAVLVLRDEAAARQQARDPALRSLLVGESPALRTIRARIAALADVPTTVLVTGETGAGKEVVVDALHAAGHRWQRPLIKVNCAALPETLLESELFGHVRGAFTGADHDREGRFQAAAGGTIFLDEISEISPRVQVLLLRVLEAMEFAPVGTSRSRRVDARVIAATNRDLAALVAAGSFRRDLYHRLKVFTLHVPPLREHREDIPLLVAELLARLERRLGKRLTGVSDEVMGVLLRHPWPGNVRELEHVLEHAGVVAAQEVISRADLPAGLGDEPAPARCEETGSGNAHGAILAALRHTGGNREAAARLLGMSRRTLYRRLAHLAECEMVPPSGDAPRSPENSEHRHPAPCGPLTEMASVLAAES